jgi:hypothetical protein
MVKLRPELELAGSFGVDAGLCWIGDPCYVMGGEDMIIDDEKGYSAPLGYGVGMAVATGYGDGEYDVYVRRTEEGRIAEISIMFIDAKEIEEEWAERPYPTTAGMLIPSDEESFDE